MESKDEIVQTIKDSEDVTYPTTSTRSKGQSEKKVASVTTTGAEGHHDDDYSDSEKVGQARSLTHNREKELSPLARVLLEEVLRVNYLRSLPEPAPQEVVEDHPWEGPAPASLFPDQLLDDDGFRKLSRKEKALLDQGKDISSSIQVTFGSSYFDMHPGPRSLDDTHVPMVVLDDGRVTFGHNKNLEGVAEGRNWKAPIEEEEDNWEALLAGWTIEDRLVREMGSSEEQSGEIRSGETRDDEEF